LEIWNAELNSIEKKNRGTSSIQLNILILQLTVQACQLHRKEDPVYVFPEKKLRCLVLNFHIHVSVSDLYIPTTGPPILLSDLYIPTIGPPFCYS
jgi:hypothetical protein